MQGDLFKPRMLEDFLKDPSPADVCDLSITVPGPGLPNNNLLAPLQSLKGKLGGFRNLQPRPEHWTLCHIVPGLTDQHHCAQVSLARQMTEDLLQQLWWQNIVVCGISTSDIAIVILLFLYHFAWQLFSEKSENRRHLFIFSRGRKSCAQTEKNTPSSLGVKRAEL